MSALRIVLTVFGSVVAAAFVVAAFAMVTTALAVATSSTVSVPGLVTATASAGADLAFTRFASPGSAVWFVVITAAIAAPSRVASRAQARRRATTGHLDQP